MSSVSFHKAARNELLEARDYYDNLVYGLGKLFVNEIERCLNIIKVNPLAYPVLQKNIRKAVLLKFPYSLLYKSEKETTIILAVMHQKRKPQYWDNRI